MNIDNFLTCFDQPRKVGRNWLVRCAAHKDRTPSLSIAEGDDGRILLRCFSGCSSEDIVEQMGLSLSDLFPEAMPPRQKSEYLKQKEAKQEITQEIHDLNRSMDALFRKSEATIRAATGIDISGWSEGELDRAMDILGDAYAVVSRERLKELVNE